MGTMLSMNYIKQGFALPTVLIASVVMLVVLTTTLTAVVTSQTALDAQYYQQLAREAAESGLAKAQACLKSNNYEPQWAAPNTLRPETSCTGSIAGGASQYVLNDSKLQTRFTVQAPQAVANGVQRVTVTGLVEQLRSSTGSVWRTYSADTYSIVSGNISFDQVTFGYNPGGSFFGTIDAQGQANTLGYNGAGQLGNGTTNVSLSPQRFMLPSGARAQAMFSNFLSVGHAMFVITTDGRLFGAGQNDVGQLGNGTLSTRQSTPLQFFLPAGVQARYVAVLEANTYVIGSDNNIYSTGACIYGALGTNYTINGCSDRSTYGRVALPAVNTADPGTLPVASSDWVQSTNLVTDRRSVYIRMQGGQVYGWGMNDLGQMADGTRTDRPAPVRIGSWGDAGNAKATQIAFDGETTYVLDSSGSVYAFGSASRGALAGARSMVKAGVADICIDNPNNSTTNGSRIRTYTCNTSAAQKMEWTFDGQVKFRPNTTQEFCLDNAGNANTNGNPIQLYECNNTAAQQWTMRDDGSIYHPASGKCLDNPGNSTSSGTNLQLYDCNASQAQQWAIQQLLTPEKVPIPSSSGKVTRITNDQWSVLFLTEDGKVWGAGGNDIGQLGNGTTANQTVKLTQYIVPAGRKVVDFYTTKNGVQGSEYANTYVILDDGSVYGSGGNSFGQLGFGATSPYETTARKMSLPPDVRARSIQSGQGTTVILTDQGRIYTVGNNANGQLGDGTTNNSSLPRANRYTNVVPVRYY